MKVAQEDAIKMLVRMCGNALDINRYSVYLPYSGAQFTPLRAQNARPHVLYSVTRSKSRPHVRHRARHQRVLSLLALLVQKYKYRRFSWYKRAHTDAAGHQQRGGDGRAYGAAYGGAGAMQVRQVRRFSTYSWIF